MVIFVSVPAIAGATTGGLVGGDQNWWLNTTTTAYNGLSGGSRGAATWDTTAANEYQPIPTSVTLTKLKVELLDGAPGAGKSYTFDIVKNVAGTPTDASDDCVVSGTGTTCETAISVSLSQQDLVALRCVPSGTPTQRGATWYVEYTPGTANETIFLSAPYAAISTIATRYCSLAGHCTINTGQNERILMPTTGTLKKLTVYSTAAPGAGKSHLHTVTVRPSLGSISNTSIAVTISESETIDSDNTNTKTVTAGDSYEVSITPSGTPASAQIGYGLVFTTDTAGEFVVPGWGTGNTSSTTYCDMQGSCGLTEAYKLGLSGDFTWKKIYAEALTAPAGSGTYTITLRKEKTTDTLLSCALTNAAPSCNDTDDVTATALENWAIKNVPATTPGAQNIMFGILGYIAPPSGERRMFMVM